MKYQSIKNLYGGKFLHLHEATYLTSSGEKKYEILSRKKVLDLNNKDQKVEAVGIIITDEFGDKILVCKEFRLPVNDWVYNFPGGLVDPGECPEETAKRELFEETGLELYEITAVLPPSVTAIGFCDEKVITIIGKARGELKPSSFDEEEIEPAWYSKDQVRNMIKDSVLMSIRTQSYLALWSGFIQ